MEAEKFDTFPLDYRHLSGDDASLATPERPRTGVYLSPAGERRLVIGVFSGFWWSFPGRGLSPSPPLG